MPEANKKRVVFFFDNCLTVSGVSGGQILGDFCKELVAKQSVTIWSSMTNDIVTIVQQFKSNQIILVEPVDYRNGGNPTRSPLF